MIGTICSGLVIGLFLPAVAGRFGKILPADPGLILRHLWHRPHFPKVRDVARAQQLQHLWYKLIGVSIAWSIVLAGLFAAARLFLPQEMAGWAPLFITLIAVCMIVDADYFLLPDFFTIPLLLTGFGASIFIPALSPMASFSGALFGYLLATLAVFIAGGHNRELGFGDVKMLTALGAWLGVMGLNLTLLLSFFLFAIPAVIQMRRQGAYGPALGLAALISFFIIYAN